MLRGKVVWMSVTTVVAGLVISGCATNTPPKSGTPDSSQTVTVGAPMLQGVYAQSFTDAKSMTRSAELVVVGQAQGVIGTRNMARDPKDHSKEDTNIKVIGVDFRVAVARYLKGSGPREIVITQPQLMVFPDGGQGTYPAFSNLETGERYLLFIRSANDGTDRYVGTGEPWRFLLKNSRASIATNDEQLRRKFSEIDETTLLKDIEAIAKGN
jgi:hypothetical protein